MCAKYILTNHDTLTPADLAMLCIFFLSALSIDIVIFSLLVMMRRRIKYMCIVRIIHSFYKSLSDEYLNELVVVAHSFTMIGFVIASVAWRSSWVFHGLPQSLCSFAMTGETPCACIHDADAVAREDRMADDLTRAFLLLFWGNAKKVSGVSVF